MGLLTHDDLINKGEKWLRTNTLNFNFYRCPIILTEYTSFTDEIPDIIGFGHMRSVVIECKVSRTDFLADYNKSHRLKEHQLGHLGNCRFYLTTSEIISIEDLPEGWGLLYANSKGCSLIKEPICDTNPLIKAKEWELLYSIIRRCNNRGYLKNIQDYSTAFKDNG